MWKGNRVCGFGGIMGCGGSKDVDESMLVKLCRERKELIKAAAGHRYALAAAHLCYLKSLKDIGESLEKFVYEEIVVGGSSEPDSPVLTLPSDEGKRRRSDGKSSSSSTSISHSASHSHNHSPGMEGEEDSHLHLSSESDSELDPSHGHADSPSENVYYRSEMEAPYYPPYDPYATMGFWGPPTENSNAYYMRKTPTEPLTVFKIPPRPTTNRIKRKLRKGSKSHVTIFEDSQGSSSSGYENGLSDNASNSRKNITRKQVTIPKETTEKRDSKGSPHGNSDISYMRRTPSVPNTEYGFENPQGSPSNRFWQDSSNNNPSYSHHNNTGYFGFLSGSSMQNEFDHSRMQQSHPPTPPEPPAPNASGWDFMNIFNTWDQYEPSFYPKGKYTSTSSSPDSKEVREREGIPDLEYETESETLKTFDKGKKLKEEYSNYGEGTSRPAPSQFSDETFWTMSSHRTGGTSKPIPSRNGRKKEDKMDNSDNSISQSSEEELVKKKGVTFEMDRSPRHDIESVRPDSAATLATHGGRDLQEVIGEIKDEFHTASENGKEILLILEVGTLPYQSRSALLKAMLNRILHLRASSKNSSSAQYIQMATRTMKMAKALYGDLESELNRKPGNLSFVLDELYAWEKKLYKEVKDEERLRFSYEKACKRLRGMDVRGVEASKIDRIQDSIKKYLTKIKVQIKSIEAISSRINSLRDRELEPQLKDLIHGLIQMWKSMLKCHQKQFQAIMESKHRNLKANVGSRRDSSLRAAFELEVELVNWCSNFRSWIASQKCYIKSLNDWLMKCLSQEQEVTADGPVPFSPGRMKAPQVFIICHDWFQAMERVSDYEVKKAMDEFASMLHQLWETQDLEQRQRLRSEDIIKQYEITLKKYRMEKGRMEDEHEASLSEKTAGSMVPSESKISQLDDLKSDLDSMRKKLEEERARHKESVKQIHSTASDSIQSGLVPIFESLKQFSSEALQAHEQVRLQNPETVS
ncbi:unnamed protein product [Rhodiola kirilowii]